MALPLIAIVGIGAAAGAALGAPGLLSGMGQARSLEQAANFQRQVAEVNATTLRRQAEAERIQRESEEAAERDVVRRKMARIEAAYAKSGVLMEGTPALMIESEAAMDERAILQRTQDALYNRMALRTQARNLKIEAGNVSSAMRTQAKSIRFQSMMGFGTGVVGGAAGGFMGAGGLAAGASAQPFSWSSAFSGYNTTTGLLGGSRR